MTPPSLTSARVALRQQSQGSALLFNGIAAAFLACVLSFHHPAGGVMAWLGIVLATSAMRTLTQINRRAHRRDQIIRTGDDD